ncbi:hypothetical protein SISSUDRAFT_1061658 [Sistotremastrum suecicum HHB10207 ss-3]|uniref:Uncharacterized protein n=1 Tax=Sistotremastrum suecicum HHB10207 ss-3 TaxID=1314776 RepID=A0A166DS88_9AGAM|nr:hypothetical protein SISSUDRAFT_1061658 [Sistotremastrum suecicum HHB10207 ss-3]
MSSAFRSSHNSGIQNVEASISSRNTHNFAPAHHRDPEPGPQSNTLPNPDPYSDGSEGSFPKSQQGPAPTGVRDDQPRNDEKLGRAIGEVLHSPSREQGDATPVVDV